MEIIEKITKRTARIGIIGLGYVGLPLVREFVRAGFPVTGFDIDPQKVKLLREGKTYIKHIPAETIAEMNRTKRFTPTADFSKLKNMESLLICVPTPLNQYREPDLTYVFETAKTIAKYLRKNQLIVLESTTYPGTTDDDMRKILEGSGLRAGRDFFLAYSPEREDPGNQDFSTAGIPKVVGGYTANCLKVAKALYDTVVTTVPVGSTRVAEAAKLFENIFRSVNIALVNELKMLFDRMGIDVWEVIRTASTKPFGFMPFYPGPGLGGHCIPIDPFYLTWKARQYDFNTRFIELAGEINTFMPYYVVGRIIDALNAGGKGIKGSRILIVGLAYKKDVDDVRESPSLKLIELLTEKGAVVDYNDPHVPKTHRMRRYDFKMSSVPLTPQNLRKYDCVVISTNHSSYDYKAIVRHSRLIVDTRNATEGIKSPKIFTA
ncbi:MAG: nucleotide sugar dehydrogenase [Nitrospirae bacterium]|nr:nucleotide sugar dehydrogenase [Nitrospirota bacterium]MCL5421843.1 nucleotide sugar dehydrogenase [Nitrospirota bacterium]